MENGWSNVKRSIFEWSNKESINVRWVRVIRIRDRILDYLLKEY
jgi:hypothetical protein